MTVQDIVNKVLALFDETVFPTTTINKLIQFIDMGQKEISRIDNHTKIYTYSQVADSQSAENWAEVDMPDDFHSLKSVVKETVEGRYTYSKYRWVGTKTLLVSTMFDGSIYLEYEPLLEPLTSVTDSVVADSTTALALVYYAGSLLAPSEQPSLEPKFREEFEKLKFQLIKARPAETESIEDGTGLLWRFR